MQLALLSTDPEEQKPAPRPELVTEPPAIGPHEPEQLPLIRMLAVVSERIESMHAGQRSISADLRRNPGESRGQLQAEKNKLMKNVRF